MTTRGTKRKDSFQCVEDVRLCVCKNVENEKQDEKKG